MQQQDETNASAAWGEAGRALGIEVEAPFTLRHGSRDHVCLAYLPHFGGGAGILVAGTRSPNFTTDKVFSGDAESDGYSWTFLNLCEYQKFDGRLFIETLTDWGCTGPDDKRPSWL